MMRTSYRLSKKSLLLFSGSLLLMMLALTLLKPSKAEAASYTYPQGGLYAVASRSPGVYLDAPRSVLKVNFSSDTNVYQIVMWDLCFHSGVDYSSFGPPGGCVGGQATVQVCGSNAAGDKDTGSCWQADAAAVGNTPTLYFHCNGCPGGGTGLNAPVHDGMRTLYVMVVQNTGGLNGYRMTATGFQSNGVTQTGYTRIGFGATVGNGALYPQALMYLPLGGDGNTGNISITFKTPCSYSGGSFPIAWFDADRPPSSTPSDPDIYWVIRNNNTGQQQNSATYAFWNGQSENAFLGGQGVYGSTNVRALFGSPMTIAANNSYTWTWAASNGNNGIQFYLPFSDADVDIACDSAPQIAIYAECTNRRVVLQTNDPDGGSLNMRYRITNAASPPSGPWVTPSPAAQTVGPFVNATWYIDMSTMTATTTWRIEAQTQGNSRTIPWVSAPTRNYASCTAACTATFNPSTTEQGGQSTPSIQITNNTPGVMNGPLRVTITAPDGSAVPGYNNAAIAGFPGAIPAGASRNRTLTTITAGQMGTYILTAIYNGVSAYNGSSTTCGTLITVNKPYVRAYGSDISAGMSSGCSPNWGAAGAGKIRGFRGYADAAFTTPDVAKGSGAQLGVFARDTIDNTFPAGFSSAVLRGGPPSPPIGLSFANTGPFTPGFFTTGAWCPYDYWGNRTAGPAPDLGNLNNNVNGSYQTPAGAQTVPGQSINAGKQLVIYVSGPLTISGNVILSDSTTWNSPANIASITFVVNSDIYIDRTVTQLDGTYIAQGGTIFTCTNNGAVIDPITAKFSQCNNQLAVNGSLVGRSVRWQRTYGSARDSAAGENPLSAPRADCSNRPATASTITCASEYVNYTPDVYAIPGVLGIRYDYVTALPPIL